MFLQQLALLQGFDLDATEHLSADWIHTVVEAGKLAFADREAWYGEATDAATMIALLSDDYNAARRQLIATEASGDLRPGQPLAATPVLPAHALDAASRVAPSDPTEEWSGAGEPTADARVDAAGAGGDAAGVRTDKDGRVRGDTCHLDVADRWGNLVSATPSGGWLQSSPTIPELGFCLGTRAQMFWLEPGRPNSLRPGARPRTTLSPSLALRDGRPWLAFGTPGGDQQDQWSLHLFLALVHAGGGSSGADLRRGLDHPMLHTEHFPSSFWPREASPRSLVVEHSVSADVRRDLARRGHAVTTVPAWTLSRLSAVAREGSVLKGAADVRGGEGYAAGR